MHQPRAKQAFIFVYTFERKKTVIDKLTMSKIGRELPQINNATAQSAVQAAQINVKDIFDEVNNSRNALVKLRKSSVRNVLAKSLLATSGAAKKSLYQVE